MRHNLFAPWRIKYLERPRDGGGCIFCDKAAENSDEASLILFRGRECFVMMNAYPYAAGHLMVAPCRHTADFAGMSHSEREELVDLLARCTSVLKKAMNPEGFNVGLNLGRASGAGIADHLHWHVVPRWVGDTSFMPITGDTHIINEALAETYRKLKPLFEEKL